MALVIVGGGQVLHDKKGQGEGGKKGLSVTSQQVGPRIWTKFRMCSPWCISTYITIQERSVIVCK